MGASTTQAHASAAAHDAGNGNGNGNGSRGSAAPGSRLAEAFDAVERFPVLIESRERVIAAATADTARIGELVEAVESDVARSEERRGGKEFRSGWSPDH